MATQLASIGVGKLSSTAKYVDTFIVEIYSDSGYTVKIGQQTSTAQWNGSAWVQKDAIIFGGLVFGTTYYLRAAVIAPTSGAISAWTTFNTAAGSASAPGCTYTGTFTATTSGIGYIVTPASVPSDIDHFEAVWVWDSSTPASTIGSYWTGQITNSNITFFVGGKPGDTAKVYVRAVNTSQQAQAWQLIDTRTVSTTWSGTTIGTIGDGTLLGTGGPSVNSGSTGRLGLAGAVGAAFLTGFGATAAMSAAGNVGYNSIDTTPTTGRTYAIYSGSGLYATIDNTAGSNRTFLNSSGQYGIGATPADQLSVFGSAARVSNSGASNANYWLSDTTTGGRNYATVTGNGNGVFQIWDGTAGATRTTVNSSGQYGIGVTPSFQLDASGQVFSRTSGAGFSALDRTGSNFVTLYSTGAIPRLNWNSADFTTFNPSTGAMGIGGTYTGDWISVQGVAILDGSKVLQANLANADKVAADGTTYGRTRTNQLQSGTVIGRSVGKNLLGNPGLENNFCNTPINTDLALNADASDEWTVLQKDSAYYTVKVFTAAPRTGTNALEIRIKDSVSVPSDNVVYGAKVVTKSKIAVAIGDVVRISGWVLFGQTTVAPAGVTFSYEIAAHFFNAAGTILGTLNYLFNGAGNSTYTFRQTSVQVPATIGGGVPSYALFGLGAFVQNNSGSALSTSTLGYQDVAFDDLKMVIQNTAFDLTYINTASTIIGATNPLTQHGTASTQIDVASFTVQTGDGQITYSSGSVDPGSFGTWNVYLDDITYSGGAVTYQATSVGANTVASNGRFFVGTITTVSGSIATGTGGGTGGGGVKGKGSLTP